MTNSQEPNQTTLDGGTMVVRSDSERPWIIGISRALWKKPLGFWSFFVLSRENLSSVFFPSPRAFASS